MNKTFLSLLILGVLGAGGLWGWNAWKVQKRPPTISAPATTAQVELRDIRIVLSSAGDIGPAEQVSVRPEVNGKIVSLAVDIGDKVKKGDLLFTLDDFDLQTTRSTRLSEIEGARLQLKRSERNYERARKLYGDKLVSQEVFDDAVTDFELAKNALERAQKELRQVEDSISKTRISAPFDCTVLTRPVSIGQAVSGSGGFNSGTEIMSVANLNNMVVLAHINQSDVTHLSPGQRVDIAVESAADLKMTGVIERIAPQAALKNNLKGYDARIVIKKIDSKVRPGMTANLSIPVVSAESTLAVPISTVFSEPNSTTKEMERFVYVKKEEFYERRIIQVGVSDNNYVEVTDGLAKGDLICLEEPPDDSDIRTVTGAREKKKSKAHNTQNVGAVTNRTAGLLLH